MDVLLTEVLRIDALSSFWTAAMQSFLVAPVFNAATQATDLLIVAQKDYQTQASSWEGAIRSERLAVEDPGKMSELTDEIAGGRSGVLEMPYQGVASIWAYAPITPKASFVTIVPREVTDRLPEKTVGAVRAFTAESLLTTALTALGAILLAVLAALAGSRGFTRPMVELADASGRLSRGDFSVRLSTRTGDERDQVIQAFNDMVPKLEDQLRMRESLQLATEVQQNLLPRRDPCLPGLDIAGTSLYCDESGGVYYDFLEVAQDRTGAAAVVVGDVSGHTVAFLVEQGIPVMGHLGLTPQSVRTLGGYRVQGKSDEAAERIRRDAKLLQDAGMAALVLECVPTGLGRQITEELVVPTIGIGGGPHCSGQILILHDMLDVYPGKKAKIVKNYMKGAGSIQEAVQAFVREVKSGAFPTPEYCFA